MPSQTIKIPSAEERFRQAFERLKANDPKQLKVGTPVTQNNVAREAGCDPSALKKARFPVLIRQIQAYIELHPDHQNSTVTKLKQRNANRTKQKRLEDAIRQRDQAQSTLISANNRIVELTCEIQALQQQLEEIRPSSRRQI